MAPDARQHDGNLAGVIGGSIRVAFHAIVDVGNQQISALRRVRRVVTRRACRVSRRVLLREMARVIEACHRQIVARQTNRVHLEATVDFVVLGVLDYVAGYATTARELIDRLVTRLAHRARERTFGAALVRVGAIRQTSLRFSHRVGVRVAELAKIVSFDREDRFHRLTMR